MTVYYDIQYYTTSKLFLAEIQLLYKYWPRLLQYYVKKKIFSFSFHKKKSYYFLSKFLSENATIEKNTQTVLNTKITKDSIKWKNSETSKKYTIFEEIHFLGILEIPKFY